MFVSNSSVANWTEINTGLNQGVNSVAIKGPNIFASSGNEGVFLSTDNGANWTGVNAGLTSTFIVEALIANDSILIAGGNGIFLSTNNGLNWVASNSNLMNIDVSSFATYGNNVFAGTDSGIFLSTNNGETWGSVTTGLKNVGVQSLAVSESNIFAGTAGSGVWIRPLAELVTGVKKIGTINPKMFSLSQNYPNPFNPTTIIEYDLPKAEYVKIVVFDVLGKQVKTLVDEEKSGGSYKVEFNAKDLSSGVYFYQIQSKEFIQTKKFLLIK